MLDGRRLTPMSDICPTEAIEIDVLGSLAEIDARDWDACACPEADGGRPVDPFTTHRFLTALERSGSVGTGTGWQPRYLTARTGGQIIAVAPLYAKGHSQGEYIFDHNWAHAYERAGGRYYPKLQIAVPFTPATGRRLLTRPGFEETGHGRAGAGRGATRRREPACPRCTSPSAREAEAQAGEAMGLMHRISQQFHWVNDDYADFDAFLGDLSSRKRKTIRKERRTAQDFGGEIVELTGDAIQPEHWDAFWRFYQDTGARKWGTPYLTRAFFDEAQDASARRHPAGAGRTRRRFRRGRAELHRARHALRPLLGLYRGPPLPAFRTVLLSRHRLCDPRTGWTGSRQARRANTSWRAATCRCHCHSLHWIAEPAFRDAVARLSRGRTHARSTEEIEVLTSYGPFRKTLAEN